MRLPLKQIILLPFFAFLWGFNSPDLDWSEVAPTERQPMSNDRRTPEQTEPTHIEPLLFDQSTSSTINPAPSSEPLFDEEQITEADSSSQQSKPSTEAFDEDWNTTEALGDKEGEIAISAIHALKLKNIRFEPIWRPIYSQIKLEDFSKFDCCTRVLQSSLWEAEGKCEKIGSNVWQVGNIPFSTEKPPIETIKSCKILSKVAIGRAWKYSCIAKAQAKCYDPKLDQNIQFLEQLEAERAVTDSLNASKKDKNKKKEITPIDISLEALIERISNRPQQQSPTNLQLPEVSLE